MYNFFTSRNTASRCHPAKNDQELRKREIPSCFFDLVITPGETVEDCSIEAFARRALERTSGAKDA